MNYLHLSAFHQELNSALQGRCLAWLLIEKDTFSVVLGPLMRVFSFLYHASSI